jgi:hypothetical protein
VTSTSAGDGQAINTASPACGHGDDDVPGCDTGPLDRLRWVISELHDIIRHHRSPEQTGRMSSASAGRDPIR